MNRLVLLDFDGTVIRSDSMWVFLRAFAGPWFYLRMIVAAPVIVVLACIRSRSEAKRWLLSFFLKGESLERISGCARQLVPRLLADVTPQARRVITEAASAGCEVAIVTASPSLWVAPVADALAISVVIGTELLFDKGRYTGRFATPNCVGEEKVRRVMARYGITPENRDRFHITAYGDSAADAPLLRFSNEPYLNFTPTHI